MGLDTKISILTIILFEIEAKMYVSGDVLKWLPVGHLENFQHSEKTCIVTIHGTSNSQNMKSLHGAILAGRCDTHFAKEVVIFACFFAHKSAILNFIKNPKKRSGRLLKTLM